MEDHNIVYEVREELKNFLRKLRGEKINVDVETN
jgi:hypothetical protein